MIRRGVATWMVLLTLACSADLGDPGVPEDVSAETCTGMMFIDFPCTPFDHAYCTSATTFRRMETKGCADIGLDPRCCSGLTCIEGPVEHCPNGTICWNYSTEVDACRPIQCGRESDSPCEEGHFCDPVEGDCTDLNGGFCKSKTDCQLLPNTGEPLGWVCGCDHVSYSDDCARRAVGVGRLSGGPCCDPTKLLLDEANPQHFTQWLVCGQGTDGLLAVAKFTESKNGDCVQPNAAGSWGCAVGEWACRGDLLVMTDSSIVDVIYQWLCQITGLPGVSRVQGIVPAGG